MYGFVILRSPFIDDGNTDSVSEKFFWLFIVLVLPYFIIGKCFTNCI